MSSLISLASPAKLLYFMMNAGDTGSTATWIFYELDDLLRVRFNFHISITSVYSQADVIKDR
jgi:hypothetical protein